MDYELIVALEGARRLARRDWQTAVQRFELHPNAVNYTQLLQCSADYQAATYEVYEAKKQASNARAATDWAVQTQLKHA